MRDALLEATGCYAPYLHLARACERFDQGAISQLAQACGLQADDVNLAHVKGLV